MVQGELAASFVCAALAALGNATANVAQRKASLEQDPEEDFSLRVLGRIMRRGIWILGFSGMVFSFLLQAVALGLGPLSAVEPIITLEVPLTLLVASWVFGSAPGRLEWLAILAMTGGMILLIACLDPKPGHALQVSNIDYLVAGTATTATIAALALAGIRGPRVWRAALLGAAAGTCFGFTATLIKEVVGRLEHGGFVAILSTWQTYAAMSFGIAGVLVMQWALHSGPLLASQPGFTLMDPIVSVLWGVLIYDETTRQGWWLLPAVGGMTLLGAGVVVLARSPLLAAAMHEPDGTLPDTRTSEVGDGLHGLSV
jgi:drug/metabolite transporter (DMT)-like permease